MIFGGNTAWSKVPLPFECQRPWSHLPRGATGGPARQRSDKFLWWMFSSSLPKLLSSYKEDHVPTKESTLWLGMDPLPADKAADLLIWGQKAKKEKNWEGKGESWSKGEEERNPKYLLSSLVRLCWVLAGHVSCGAVSWLEGHWAKRTLVEDFAVFLMDVHFQHGEGHEDNSTMDAPGGCTKKEPNYSHGVDSNTHTNGADGGKHQATAGPCLVSSTATWKSKGGTQYRNSQAGQVSQLDVSDKQTRSVKAFRD